MGRGELQTGLATGWSLAIDRELLGDEHPNVAITLGNLGILLRSFRGWEPAEPLLREALAIKRKVLGDHPGTAGSMTALGSVLSRKGDTEEAEKLFREALEMQRRFLGNDHPGIAYVLNSLARELRRAGRLEEAEPLYREAIAMRNRERLVKLYEAWGQPDKAAEYRALAPDAETAGR